MERKIRVLVAKVGLDGHDRGAKVIATADTRDSARTRAIAALRNFPILGVRTNVPFLIRLLEHPSFVAGELDTRLLDREGDALRAASVAEPGQEVMAVAEALRASVPSHLRTRAPAHPRTSDPWSSLRGIRV